MPDNGIVGIDWQWRLDMSKLKVLSFTGKNGAGACTLTGVTVGSKVLSVTGVASATKGNQAANFEADITVADQIQQSAAGDLSLNVYEALIYLKG